MNRMEKVGKQTAECGNQKSTELFRRLARGPRIPYFLLIFSWFPVFLIHSASAVEPVMIGSKKFTESYVLGEIARRALNNEGIPAEHRQGMGGTIILRQALRGRQ